VLALTYTGGVYSWGEDLLPLGHGTPSRSDTSASNSGGNGGGAPVSDGGGNGGGASVSDGWGTSSNNGSDTAIGDGNGASVVVTRTRPERLPKRIKALRGVRMRCVAAGKMHSCAVTEEGHVYTWGEGKTGALGHMHFEDEPLPKRIETLYDNGVVAVGVAAGAKHTLVADADGAAWGFGCLNAIGVWNDPVEAMREAENSHTGENENGHTGENENSHTGENENSHTGENENSHTGENENSHTGENENSHTGESEVFASASDDVGILSLDDVDNIHQDCFRFPFPRGISSISKPLRIKVNGS
jgi:alpha-tubulin suppressor-like RCC1 family protein